MIISALRRLYHALVPIAVRRRLHITRLSKSRRARAELWRRTGGRVAAGPFAGLRLEGDTPGDCESPVLLGSYECDTHEWLEREIVRGWRDVVNVGSNVGVYSTGLALRLPNATVYAYEMDDALRVATARSAERNGVGSRVHALGKADPATLAALGITGALVVCDCEGYERELLDPAQILWLADSAMLVELHDFAAAGATEVLLARFSASHEVRIVDQAPRIPTDWAARAGITRADAKVLSLEERRWDTATIPGRWMLLSPHAV